MLIKAAVNENCTHCGRFVRQVSPAQYGCDECQRPIEPFGSDERLEVSVFHPKGEAKNFYFCSWACVFRFIRKIKTEYFFSLPYVDSTHKIKGRRLKDFMAILKKLDTSKEMKRCER